MSRVLVILNGLPVKVRHYYQHFHSQLTQKYEVHVRTTTRPGEATEFAASIAEHSADVLLIAGGDGTVHECVNGLLSRTQGGPVQIPVGIIPLGNGNDFAKTVSSREASDILAELESAPRKLVDAGKIECHGFNRKECTHYFINIADVGASTQVVQLVSTYGWMRRSHLAYYRAVLTSLVRYRCIPVKARAAEWSWSGSVRSFAVANGERHGNGLFVTPGAKLDDGIFDCFIAGEVGVGTFIMKTVDLLKGRRIIHPQIQYRQTAEVALTSTQECLIQADGELVGYLPARFSILPKRLVFLV